MNENNGNAIIENIIADNNVGLAVDADMFCGRTPQEINRAIANSVRLVGFCVTAYKNYDKFKDEKAVRDTVNLWAEFFIDDDWRIVALAVKKHISICVFPPSVAEIRGIMADIQGVDIIPPDEAWAVVAKYIDVNGEFGAWERPEMQFPPAVIRAVNAVGYRNLKDLRRRQFDHSGKKTGLDRVAFIQAYESEYERERQNSLLPQHLRNAISSVQQQYSNGERALLEKTSAYLTQKDNERRDMLDYITKREYEKLIKNGSEDNE